MILDQQMLRVSEGEGVRPKSKLFKQESYHTEVSVCYNAKQYPYFTLFFTMYIVSSAFTEKKKKR